MTDEKISRINVLARKSRTVGLTPEETEEQAKLRREYIDSVKASLTGQLDNTYVLEPDGKKRKLRKKSEMN